MRNLEENLLFSTLILGSVFSDYVVFYGDTSSRKQPLLGMLILIVYSRFTSAMPLVTAAAVQPDGQRYRMMINYRQQLPDRVCVKLVCVQLTADGATAAIFDYVESIYRLLPTGTRCNVLY